MVLACLPTQALCPAHKERIRHQAFSPPSASGAWKCPARTPASVKLCWSEDDKLDKRLCWLTSTTGTPTSACFKTATICSTEKRFLLTANLPSLRVGFCRKLTLNLDQKMGCRSGRGRPTGKSPAYDCRPLAARFRNRLKPNPNARARRHSWIAIPKMPSLSRRKWP